MSTFKRLLAAGALLLASGMSGPAAYAGTYEMIITNEISSTHWMAGMMEDYAETLRQRSGGRIDPKIYHSGTLFKDKEALAALGTGAVHMVWPVSVQLESVAPEYGVINLPFSVSDEFMQTPGVPEALAAMLSGYVEDHGIRVMGLMRTADLILLFRAHFAEQPEDLNGYKVRVVGGKILQDLIRRFGASPITMPATEMATAMMQGAIDGIFTSAEGWKMVGPSTATKATRIPGMSLLTSTIAVDDAWLKGLPDDIGQIIEDSMNEVLATQWQQGIDGDNKTMQELIDQGGSFKEIKGKEWSEFKEIALEANKAFIDRHPKAWDQYQVIVSEYQ